MSDFAGIVALDGGAVDEASLARIVRVLDRCGSGRTRSWRPTPSVLLVERRGQPGYDNGAGAEIVQRDAHRTLLVTARLDAPRDAARALGLAGDVPDDRTLVAAAALAWGPAAAVRRLYGDVSIAEWDERTHRLTIARDALGARPVYSVTLPDRVIFATCLQILLALPDVPRTLDDGIVAQHMTIEMQPQHRTIYAGIDRIVPGSVATFERGRWRHERWFTHDGLAPVRFAGDGDYVAAARDLLDRAVAARLSDTLPNAVSLSGGFDSAGVAATAARLRGDRPLPAFTRAAGAEHPDDGFDERGLAGLVAARYANIDWTVVDDTRESIRDVEPEAEMGALLVPRQGSFTGTWFESLNMAVEARGIGVMLGGGSGNSTLSWRGTPTFGGRVRHGDLGGAAHAAWRALAPRALQRRVHDRHGRPGKPWLSFCLVSPDFLDEIDYPARAIEGGHDIPFRRTIPDTAARLRMLQVQRGRDMAWFARQRWRANPRDPYHDRALVEFTLAIPDDQYWRDGTSRRLARRVLADRVPAEILAQRQVGRQSPEWYFLATRRLAETAEAIERLARSPAAARVIDIPRMRRIVAEWPRDADHADVAIHGHALHRAIALGGFLRWHEGGNG